MGLRKDHIRHSKKITRGPRWQALRLATLERDGWKCVCCGERRRLEVDHVKPVRTHPHLAYTPSNLQALCGPCHTKKTRIEVGFKPLSKDRLAWRESVLSLEGQGKQPNEHKGKPHA